MQAAKEVAFHQAVRAPLAKSEGADKTPQNHEYELRQLLSRAIVREGVTDIFRVAGLESPNISILSDEFLEEVMKMLDKNLEQICETFDRSSAGD